MKNELEDIVIDKARGGDYGAFRYIVDKYKTYVFTICYKIIRNREDAEEIAQDCFVKVFKSLKDFKSESKFSTWLYRIAFNQAVSKTRKKYLIKESLDDELEFSNEPMVSEGFKNLGDEERGHILKKAIQELNEDEALLINLYYWQECAMSEVADVTGLEENFIKVKIHRARSKLLKILSESMGIKKEDVL